MTQYKTVIRTVVDSQLIKDWEKLWEHGHNHNLYNSYRWFRMCRQAFPTQQFHIYTWYQENSLVGILPLSFGTKFGVRVALPLGIHMLINSPFLVRTREPSLYKTMFTTIAKTHNLYLPNVDENDAKSIHGAIPDVLGVLVYIAPYIDLLSGDSLRYLSPSNRKELEHIISKNSDRLRYREYDFRDDLDEIFEVMIKVDTESGKSRRGMDIFSNEDYVRLYRAFIHEYQQTVRINFLYYDNVPIAYTLCFVDGRTYVGAQASYLPEYKKLSPGRTIFIYILKNIPSAIDTFDLCGGLNTYKTALSSTFAFKYDLFYSSNIIVILWWEIVRLAGRIKQKLLPKKYTMDHEFIFKKIGER